MQLNRNSLKTDTFHEPTAYKPHDKSSSKQITNFARHAYERLGIFIIISSKVIASQKLSVLKLFPSDYITLYVFNTYFFYQVGCTSGSENSMIWKKNCFKTGEVS